MELDLQSIFGLHMRAQLYSLAETENPQPGAYLGFCQGGCTFLTDLPPLPRSWIRIRIKILSWIRIRLRIRIKTMRIHSPGLNCQKIVV